MINTQMPQLGQTQQQPLVATPQQNAQSEYLAQALASMRQQRPATSGSLAASLLADALLKYASNRAQAAPKTPPLPGAAGGQSEQSFLAQNGWS